MNWKRIINPDITELATLKGNLETLLTQNWKLSDMEAMDIVLSIDEAITNVIMHGYDEQSARKKDRLHLSITQVPKKIIVNLTDHGKKFDINSVPPPDLKKNLSGQKVGGFGVYMMKTLMDEISLNRENDRNMLCMKKKIHN